MRRLATSVLVLTVIPLPACYESADTGRGDGELGETDGAESSSSMEGGGGTSGGGNTTTGSAGMTDATGGTMGEASTTMQETSTVSGGATDDGTTGPAGSDSGSGDGDGDGDGSESTGRAVPVVSVSGRVRTGGLLTSPGVAGASVSLWDDPAISAVTDENGEFELVGVPANTLHHVVAAHPDYWSGINSMQTDDGDLSNFGVPMLPTATVDGAVPAVFPNGDTSAGVVFVVSSHPDTTISASVSGISLLQPGLFYANTETGLDVDSNLTQLASYPVVGILNVPDQSAGGLVVTATHPSLECAPTFSETPPVMGTHATTVTIVCE